MRRRTGTTISVGKYLAEGWRQDPCPACRGSGLAYARRPDAPMVVTGMERCRSCNGRGSTWISPQGRRAAYPGGPFLPR